jgi:hypothetical protein
MNARARAGDVTLLMSHLGGVCRREGGDDLFEAGKLVIATASKSEFYKIIVRKDSCF